MVDQPPRGRHHDLHSPAQVIDLLPFGHSAIDTRILNRRTLSKLVAFLLDLQSELAGRGQDEDDGPVPLFKVGLEEGGV